MILMEALHPMIPTISNSCSGVSLFSSSHPMKIWRKDNVFKFNIHDTKLSLRRPFSIHLHVSSTRRLQISANFIRQASRRNSLRKKLNEQLQQVSQCPRIQDPIETSDDKESSNVIPDVDDAESLKLSSNNADKDSITRPANEEAHSGPLGDSVLWNKLESWVDQCKTESEFWGVGFGPIFTIYSDLDGKTKSVIVNKEEILKRCGISPHEYNRSDFLILPEAKYKIDHANYLAKEIERGNHAFPKSSSVARFVVQGQQSRLLNTIHSLTSKPVLSSNQSKIGFILLSGFLMVCGLKALFASREAKVEYTRLEKDMLRRKVNARKENEKVAKGSVEVIQDYKEVQITSKEKPKVNKQEVMEYISKNKSSSLVANSKPSEFDCRIQEIREMARQARKDERKDSLPSASDVKAITPKEEHLNHTNGCPSASKFVVDKITNITLENQKSQTNASSASEDSSKDCYKQKGCSSSRIGLADGKSYGGEIKEKKNLKTSSNIEVPVVKPKKNFGTRRIISSVEKAREFLSQEHIEWKLKEEFNLQGDGILVNSNSEKEAAHNSDILKNGVSIPVKLGGLIDSETDYNVQKDFRITKKEDANFEDIRKKYTLTDTEMLRSSKNEGNHDQSEAGSSFSGLSESKKGGTTVQDQDKDNLAFQSSKCSVENDSTFKPTSGTDHADIEEGSRDLDHQMSTSAPGIGKKNGNTKDRPSIGKGSWIAENFHEMEQVVQKIAGGFNENYKVAREKVKEELHVCPDLIRSNIDEDGGELEWMKDDRLREIVFQVRDNELCGRDPFYLMDDEDKLEFFKGLERKVEKENENLGNLHEWIHSNIENLDYGADGISLYDTPEKIIPRWIGPPVDKIPDFLKNIKNNDDIAKNGFSNPPVAIKDGQVSHNKPQESISSKHVSPRVAQGKHLKVVNAASKEPNTVIEASDGSSRAGKKSGKEYWQHTKKWSRSFLESYNAETDPEVKAVMRTIGKDLDRWITEEEVQEAATFMDKIPEKGREYIEKKLNKVKREMEMFGPQAVVSKYKEYAEEKEIDYLWWLDLPYILCLELYIIEDGKERVGFYSLEMAEDLDLDPKPVHVIALQDPGDCKNLCYIVQAQMEMQGNGNAFVVARPPKDAFRDAKENGFSITVIRKGELQLNIDQTLEEVEEQITEIGSKIYHDNFTKERSVDMSGLMKGVFGVRKPVKRRRRAKGTLGKPRRQ